MPETLIVEFMEENNVSHEDTLRYLVLFLKSRSSYWDATGKTMDDDLRSFLENVASGEKMANSDD